MDPGGVTMMGSPNHNAEYFKSKGMWVTYVVITTVMHLILLNVFFLEAAPAWTLTTVIHNALTFVVLHVEKGTPFETPDQGKARFQTVWEQIDYGEQFSAGKKFLTIVPIVLFFLASFYTKYEAVHFVINAISLLSVLIPKLPMFHGVRLFGINKY